MSLLDKIADVASWCKSKVLYYAVYTSEQRKSLDRIRDATKSGKLEQFKPIRQYSEQYWNMKAAIAGFKAIRPRKEN